MATYLKIIKKSPSSWWFEVDNIALSLRTSSYYECNIGDTFNIVEIDGSKIFVKDIENITLIDEHIGFTYPNTNNPILLEDRLKMLNFPPYLRQSQFSGIYFTETNFNFAGLYSFTISLNLNIRQILIGTSYDVPKADYTYNPSTGALAIIGDSADLGVENGTLIRVRSF